MRLETRPANLEGSGAIPPRRLVINALRMRPDRIIVGEVRGDEALDMLQAMNTGHDGSLTTIHARAGYDAISRLETMVTMGGLEIPIPVIRAQIASAINLVVQVSRLTDGTRKVVNISEVVGMNGDEIVVLQEIFVFNKTGIGEDEMVLGEFVPTGNRPKSLERLTAAGVSLPAAFFDPREIQAFNLVVEQRGNASDLASRKAVAEALASKAAALAPLDRIDEELETYDDIVERFGSATELPLREEVATGHRRQGSGSRSREPPRRSHRRLRSRPPRGSAMPLNLRCRNKSGARAGQQGYCAGAISTAVKTPSNLTIWS